MAITSSVSNDFSANTSTLTLSSSGTQIENITYTQSTNIFSFPTQIPFSLSAKDFISFATSLDSFNLNVTMNFNTSGKYPFSVSSVSDQNDGISNCSFSFYKTNHPLYSISATYPSGTCDFSKRNQAISLTFEEWTYYQEVSKHYEQEIIKYFKI